MSKRSQFRYIGGGVFFLLLIIFLVSVIQPKGDGRLHVYFLNVGQGDAIFVQSPTGHQLLIDGGPDSAILSELGAVMSFFDRKIDLVLLTHPDADHLAGLVEVLKRYQVEAVIESGVKCQTSLCRAWDKEIQERAPKVVLGNLGDQIDLGGGVILKILSPFSEIADQTFSKVNNTSLVTRLEYRGQSVLLTGDIEGSIEDKLVISQSAIDVDFLKVAHHGSKTSSSVDFLRATSPLTAFIQVGSENQYGHPTAEILNRLEQEAIEYYRNDLSGRIELILSDQDYVVKTQR
ncbi:MAG: hypothetical protein COV31_02330 [Candidatus Yanofskybacteria bacterium CG10_big_fil_rev_8_21_14_0_10_46_23]|uniref:Metallo-beta-lactamase domain-containing protein n=1 Tax=Candidatus Yanofskybacteria bacterium CG10_big_fil_rev_8_21_14_0_10_46_23 TaxID=1975098 RepID=A0A2H0R3W5_9BACT|nr:MAG: hypothetical protein COV31_02330 [Candidatus Yanofskybacteria bacterium CG10_big_fil_rev_8_21_14_0_10_46_23]